VYSTTSELDGDGLSFYPRGGTPVPSEQETGWAPAMVCVGVEKKKICCTHRSMNPEPSSTHRVHHDVVNLKKKLAYVRVTNPEVLV